MPTEAEIEAAAAAWCAIELGADDVEEFWASVFDAAKLRYRTYARAALEAAERVRTASAGR